MSDVLRSVIAGSVRAERRRRQLTQTQLGQRVGWGVDVVVEVEAGRRPVRLCEAPALCAALQVPLARLLIDAPAEDLTRLGL